MRFSHADQTVPPFSWRRLAGIAAGGLACAVLVLTVGWALQRAILGADDNQARRRVETEVRATFDQMSRVLRQMAAAVVDPAAVRKATDGDSTAAYRLIARADDIVARENPPDAALTIYDTDGVPVAWAGRPSDLPGDRLQGSEAWFLAPVAQGLRLVYVQPILMDGTRLGTVAVERPLPSLVEPGDQQNSGLQGADEEEFLFPTALGPVSIQLPFEDARPAGGGTTFDVQSPSDQRLLTASIAREDLLNTRVRWRRATSSMALMVVAITLLLLTAPVLDWRNRLRTPGPYVGALLVIVGGILAARMTLFEAAPADWSNALVFSAAAYVSTLFGSLLSSPFDFLLTAGAAAAIVVLVLVAIEAWRLYRWRTREWVARTGQWAVYLLTQVGCGIVVAAVLFGHEALLRDTVTHTTLDLLHLSLHPLNTTRITLQIGLVLAHLASLGACVAILRAGRLGWRVPRGGWRLRLLTLVCWLLPLVVWQVINGTPVARRLPLLMAAAAAVFMAAATQRLVTRYRHGSQAFRLTLLTLPLIIPAFAFYPTVVQLAGQAKADLVEALYAPEIMNQRQTVQAQLQASLTDIDKFPDLVELVTTPASPGTETLTDRAFEVWQTTSLARYPITSSVELYGKDGRLVSRFAFNLPEDLTASTPSVERSCNWEVFEEVAPFFAEERRVLHAGRAFCAADPSKPPLGSIVVHAMPDYENLPFISSRSPYMELLRPADPLQGEGLSGRDVEFAAYGWSRTPLYPVVGTAWSIPDEVFGQVEQSRRPFWTTLPRGPDDYDVYLLNDRGGIYAVGFPVISALGHLVNLAELTVLAMGTYLLLVVASAVYNRLGRRMRTAPALLREVRASFYRKLFLAFVAAVFVPVVALVLVTRNYVAGQIEASIEQEAVRTASAAGRVVEDLVAPRAAQQGLGVDDNLMVWVSRLIDQDVNMFMGPRLLATSERNLFASGLLPTRTPSEVYRALGLRNEAAFVTRERIGTFEYLVAATPLTVRQLGILTVPLTSRQREIDRQIDTLDRRALLAALLFILAGAGLGYSMAERISDPVNRLTRATRRIARGDLDARITATSSDELRRLVEAFNSMAGDLQRQRIELERTHRLEAWAEMARQVAHEIKNPLTPIQLNAEHLRRVHADRGEPLSPVLQECVATILSQVKLLRQIASEFSSYASAPTAKPSEADVAALLTEILTPYKSGLEGRIHMDIDLADGLPPVLIDRTLVSRALVNIIENALHAMPSTGTLTVRANRDGRSVHIRVADTGVGMDAEALARAFEPYFSTKAAGTGLGLPIAKRNVELSGGTIAMSSEREKGTTVEMTLPIA